jgi:hypothetical protein
MQMSTLKELLEHRRELEQVINQYSKLRLEDNPKTLGEMMVVVQDLTVASRLLRNDLVRTLYERGE